MLTPSITEDWRLYHNASDVWNGDSRAGTKITTHRHEDEEEVPRPSMQQAHYDCGVTKAGYAH